MVALVKTICDISVFFRQRLIIKLYYFKEAKIASFADISRVSDLNFNKTQVSKICKKLYQQLIVKVGLPVPQKKLPLISRIATDLSVESTSSAGAILFI